MNNFSPLDFDIFSDLGYQDSLDNSLLKIKNPLNALANLGDVKLETEDPTPNIWEMFQDFDQRFFNNTLVNNGVQVDWSAKMTQCAGLCRWSPGNLSCEIKLSKPLLQLRSRKDLVETLIHEMIHALLFVMRDSDNRESHGPKFHEIMFRINKEANLNISVYHTFHDEVRHYQTHVWRCNGICRTRAPYYGWLRRSMNRKPGPSDNWYAEHQQTCGGLFEKVSEPENFNQKNKKSKENNKNETNSNMKDIRSFFTPTKINLNDNNLSVKNLKTDELTNSTQQGSRIFGFDNIIKEETNDLNLRKNLIPFSGEGKILGSDKILNPKPGKSILLHKFSKNSTYSSNELNSHQDKLVSSTATSSIITNSDPVFFLNKSFSNNLTDNLINKIEKNKKPLESTSLDTGGKLIVLDDINDNKLEKLNKRPEFNETVILTDDEDDDFNFLNNISNEELLGISSTDCIIID